MSIAIVETFVRLRRLVFSLEALSRKLRDLEGKVSTHDNEIQAIFEAIRQLMAPAPEPPRR